MDPRDIARAAASARAGRPGGLEITAVALLLSGGLLGLAVGNIGFGAGLVGAIVVWLTGTVMLWGIATVAAVRQDPGLPRLARRARAALPAGQPAQVCSSGSGAATRCTGGALPLWLGIPLAVVLVAAPLVVAIWLVHRARPRDQRDPAVPELAAR